MSARLSCAHTSHVDVALKYEDDDCCYAFNDETCRFVPGWRDPRYRLPDPEYRVRIVFKGVGLVEKQEHWLLLRNMGAGKGMELEASNPLSLPGASSDTT